jgi:hypothetical protein
MFSAAPTGMARAYPTARSKRSPNLSANPLAEDQAALETSPQRIRDTADRVVPGHGEPFEAGRSS